MLLIPIILAVIFFWFIGQSNKLNRYVVSIEESKKTVDITLVKRYDTISEMWRRPMQSMKKRCSRNL